MAKASAVAGVYTGSAISAASPSAPASAATWMRAGPARTASAAMRTSTRSPAGTRTCFPGSVNAMPSPRAAIRTSSASAPWFCTTTDSSKRSP